MLKERVRAAIEGERPSVRWLQPLPLSKPVIRSDYIVEACRGKRVIHLGFVDEYLQEEKQRSGRWLHEQIARVASSIVGIDLERAGVELAKSYGYEAYSADCQNETELLSLGLEPADIVVAGEIIEHLEAPGYFLRAARGLCAADGLLIVTTPNAYKPLNACIPLIGKELIHPDHTAWHSPHTLRVLAERAGWHVARQGYYQNPLRREQRAEGFSGRVLASGVTVVRNVLQAVVQRAPYWSDGLIVELTLPRPGS